jgi:hypothetical protein
VIQVDADGAIGEQAHEASEAMEGNTRLNFLRIETWTQPRDQVLSQTDR